MYHFCGLSKAFDFNWEYLLSFAKKNRSTRVCLHVIFISFSYLSFFFLSRSYCRCSMPWAIYIY